MSLLHNIVYPLLKPYILNRSKKAYPKVEGLLELKGLSAEAEVIRDQWGVPHIYAKNIEDLSLTQGYVQAQDRLWQMELTRRLSQGRLSEVIGEPALDTDRLIRTVGLHRLGKADVNLLDTELKGLLQKFVDGINQSISDQKDKLPVEFKLLKFEPEPWDTKDVMCITRLLGWQMSHAWYHEWVRAMLTEKVGPEKMREIDISYPKANPIGLANGIEFNELLDDGKLKAMKGPYITPGVASNAWAISGNRTDTGKTYLCNDPHLQVGIPLIWYENHLSAGDLEVTGVTVPGTPMGIIGHNQKISWGVTLAYTDCEDLFTEQYSDSDHSHYQFKGESLPLEIYKETIKIKGKPAHIETVRATHHGPILSEFVGNKSVAISLNSKSFAENNISKGVYKLNKSKNWNDFVESMACFNAPQLNIVYADTDGNIGYWVTGDVPIRMKGNGSLPANGSSGEEEWQGNVPFKAMPHAFNPNKGYVLTCNHKIIPDDYPYFLGNTWMNGFRAKRLEEYFSQNEKLNLGIQKAMQNDYTSLPGKILQDKLRHHQAKSESTKSLLSHFLNWDGILDRDSTGGTIYEVLKSTLFQTLFKEEFDDETYEKLMGGGLHPVVVSFSEFYRCFYQSV